MDDASEGIQSDRKIAGAQASRMAIDFEGAQRALRDVFGFASLRKHQAEILSEVLDGQDCLGVIPTGSGKSLCYALPAILRPGLTLVVSPLIALIRDQVQRYRHLGIACASLDSLQSYEEKKQVWQAMQDGSLKLLFLSPERLSRVDFRAALKTLDIQMVAVDEAHCISHWGQHFRPDYRKIGEYLADLGNVQKLALTATATKQVREDIVSSLHMRQPTEVWASFVRSNLKTKIFKAKKVADQFQLTLQAVLQSEGSGIVYVPTRKNVTEVHRMLRDAGVACQAYHAGQSAGQRMAAQEAFLNDKVRVIVATQAFGMGIHKDNIRFVHHCGLPANLEQYIQEAGRAGRDGKTASCWLIYSPRDYHIRKYMLERSLPEADVLSSIWQEANNVLADGMARSRHALVQAITQRMQGNLREIEGAVDIFCREGVLTRLTSRDGHREELVVESDMADHEVAAFFAEIPHMRTEQTGKLDAIRAFVSMPDGRDQFLSDYFRPEI
jgi:ATP-dependent DNA helicase RecQ